MKIMYINHALKVCNLDIKRAEVLGNCFINKYTIKSGYSAELEKEIKKNCPEVLKENNNNNNNNNNIYNEIRVPDFYLELIGSMVNK